MDFWKTLGILLRRWYVAVPVFVVSLAIAGGVYATVPTQYESTGTIVLTSPTAGATTVLDPSKATGPGNPLLDFGGSLTITTQLLIQSLNSPSVGQQIAAGSGGGSYQAGDGLTGGPFVVIVGTAKSPALAQLTVSLALKHARTELASRQTSLKAPPSTFINTQDVVTPTPATAKIGGKVRAAGVALALGLIASLAAAFGIESVMVNRRRKRADAAGAGQAEDLDDAYAATFADGYEDGFGDGFGAEPAAEEPVGRTAPARLAGQVTPAPVAGSVAPARSATGGRTNGAARPAEPQWDRDPATRPAVRPVRRARHGVPPTGGPSATANGGPMSNGGLLSNGGPGPLSAGRDPLPTGPGRRTPTNGRPQPEPANGRPQPEPTNGRAQPEPPGGWQPEPGRDWQSEPGSRDWQPEPGGREWPRSEFQSGPSSTG